MDDFDDDCLGLYDGSNTEPSEKIPAGGRGPLSSVEEETPPHTVAGVSSLGEYIKFTKSQEREITVRDWLTGGEVAATVIGEPILQVERMIHIPAVADISHSRDSVLTDMERQCVLNWVSDLPFSHSHETNKSMRIDGTGRWLTERERFRNWNDSDSSALLWLHGIGENHSPLFGTRTYPCI